MKFKKKLTKEKGKEGKKERRRERVWVLIMFDLRDEKMADWLVCLAFLVPLLS